MHLVETSFIKKYENDIGSSIADVGGEVTYELHWLPHLDEVIKNQLAGDVIIDEKIAEKLAELGIDEDAVRLWNKTAVELGVLKVDLSNLEQRVGVLEEKPAMGITTADINTWNEAVAEISGFDDRISEIEEKPAMDITAADIEGWNTSTRWKE